MDFDIFPDFGQPVRQATNDFVKKLVIEYATFFDGVSDGILAVLRPLERLLLFVHPLVVLAVVGVIALLASRSIFLTAAVVFATWLLGAFGLWEQAMQTTAIIMVSVLISVVVGLPLGVLSARSAKVRAALDPLLDLMQTIPSFVYLIPAAMLLGLGKPPAILATVIYATPPLIRLTSLGIREVSSDLVECARSFGASRLKILTSVQLPLALPSIMQGINQTIMMALAMVVIASMIGARGIGETVLVGLQRNDPGRGLIGGLGIVLLAIIFDRISQAFGKRRQAYRQVRS